jgi:hypothetical protein
MNMVEKGALEDSTKVDALNKALINHSEFF